MPLLDLQHVTVAFSYVVGQAYWSVLVRCIALSAYSFTLKRLRFLRFSFTQRKRLRLNGNQALDDD